MKDPKENKNPYCPDADEDRPPPRPEIPPKPSRDLQQDLKRAENEGMIPHEDTPEKPAAPPP